MRTLAMLLTAMMLTLPLAGCLGAEEEAPEAPTSTVWDFERPELTWYHLPDAVDAWGNDSMVFEGRNAPFHAMGTYYGIGMSTFE
ncbi:MAG TPA: hypothetical protein HA286_04675, partial [Candidatus Poseidoniaceae archaeon]|nr:hypothetical protein [Candidatus Poseidoniaceae archaeon]